MSPSLTEVRPTGTDYLDLVTRLLQQARRREPDGGLWEAADQQWWWRIDQRDEPTLQAFWCDGSDPQVGAAFTRWPRVLGVDLLGADATVTAQLDRLTAWLGERLTALDPGAVEMALRVDDTPRIASVEALGFTATGEVFRTGWLASEHRPAVPPLPAGYRLVSYEGGPHPMVARNGEHVAARLAQCSLYRPDCDLAIRDSSGACAAYALFWPDPVTGVGLVEPMRVEDAHQGRGLGRVLLAAGLDRLAAAGATRLKVTFEVANSPAVRLYTGAGFVPAFASTSYVRRSAHP
jgi:GNAT superfamily N-acetyltransferase